MKKYYYLESDGQVYLVRRSGVLRFPVRRSEIPCRFAPIYTMRLRRADVVYAKPLLRRHPTEWIHKDEIPWRRDVDPVVQVAVNRSLTRVVAKVIICERGRVLMVKGARGLTKGIWNLPGGFIGYTESPAEGVVRECMEEIGAAVLLRRLVGVYTETFSPAASHMISFVFCGEIRGKSRRRRPLRRASGTVKRRRRSRGTPGGIRPDPDEISCVKWFPLAQAARMTRNPFARQGLRDYMRSR